MACLPGPSVNDLEQQINSPVKKHLISGLTYFYLRVYLLKVHRMKFTVQVTNLLSSLFKLSQFWQLKRLTFWYQR